MVTEGRSVAAGGVVGGGGRMRGRITKGPGSFIRSQVCALSQLQWCFHICVHISKLTQLYTLNMCSSLQVSRTVKYVPMPTLSFAAFPL